MEGWPVRFVIAKSLPPIEVREPQPLVAERRLDQADVAEVEAEAAHRDRAVLVPVLEFPDQRTILRIQTPHKTVVSIATN